MSELKEKCVNNTNLLYINCYGRLNSKINLIHTDYNAFNISFIIPDNLKDLIKDFRKKYFENLYKLKLSDVKINDLIFSKIMYDLYNEKLIICYKFNQDFKNFIDALTEYINMVSDYEAYIDNNLLKINVNKTLDNLLNQLKLDNLTDMKNYFIDYRCNLCEESRSIKVMMNLESYPTYSIEFISDIFNILFDFSLDKNNNLIKFDISVLNKLNYHNNNKIININYDNNFSNILTLSIKDIKNRDGENANNISLYIPIKENNINIDKYLIFLNVSDNIIKKFLVEDIDFLYSYIKNHYFFEYDTM